MLALLDKSDVKDFVQYHETEREKLLSGSERRLFFKVNQLDNLIERGLEELVAKAHGENLIKRWN